MTYDLVVRARLDLGDGLAETSVAISEGRIAAMARAETWDGPRLAPPGAVLLPGGIDPHAHVADPNVLPGRTYAEGGRLALLGGVTTVVELPTDAPLLDPLAYTERASLLAGCGADFGLQCGNASPDRLSELRALRGLGAGWVKGFLSPPYALSDPGLAMLMDAARDAGQGVLLHAEDGPLVERYEAQARAQGRPFVDGRPPVAEAVGIARAVRAAALAGTPLHVVHCTTGTGAAVVAAARDAGADVTTEACLHHLAFEDRDMDRLGCRLKMNPPLRPSAEREGLWAALGRGDVAMLATDHFYVPGRRIDGEIWAGAAGVPGLDAFLPVFHTLARARGWTYADIARACAGAAARRFGLLDRGEVAIGKVADLVLIDPRSEGAFETALDWSPYEGLALRGRITYVLKGGRVAVERGEVRAGGGVHVATGVGPP